MSLEIERKMILAILKDRLEKNCLGVAERSRLAKAERIIKEGVYEEIPRASIENIKKYLGVYYPVKVKKEG